MRLSILHRIQINALLPKKGDFKTLVISEELQKKIKITQEEIKEHGVESVVEDGFSGVKIKNNIEEDFVLTELEEKLVKEELDRLEKAKNLDATLLSLYRIFTGGSNEKTA